MLLFIRMDVWQQIIPVPLFLSFKVMMESTNPYPRSFRARQALPAIGIDTAQRQGWREKSNLLWVWHHAAVTSVCRCSERSFIFITHQKLKIHHQTWQPSVAWQRNDTSGNKQAADSEVLHHISSLHSVKVCPCPLYSLIPPSFPNLSWGMVRISLRNISFIYSGFWPSRLYKLSPLVILFAMSTVLYRHYANLES